MITQLIFHHMKTLLKKSSYLILVSILLIWKQNLAATNPDTTNFYRKQLKELLEVRKDKFDAYSESLEQRSGIFGNKTKSDIRESNHVLIDIVRTDNKIISTLNRVIDFRNYEKLTMNYDLQSHQSQKDKLLAANDTLNKQIQVLKKEQAKVQQSNALLKLLLGISLILIVLIFLRGRKRSLAVK